VSAWPILLPIAGAAGAAAWGAVHPTSQLLGPAICRTPRASTVALTFDDGPNPAATPQILALLEKYNAKATFFLVGQFARACPEFVRDITARGHCIGNHTETHRNLTFLPPSAIRAELQRCQESIAAATNVAPKWLRPPYGFRGPQLWGAVRRARLQGVALWSLTCYDWKAQPASRLIERLARVSGKRGQSRNGEVVLLHDGDHRQLGAERGHVVSALEHWLPRWRDNGIGFLTVDDIAVAQTTRN
jgi:peptidoglycan/xylan/chitin deacetylase (PgdA/CDA1 family)